MKIFHHKNDNGSHYLEVNGKVGETVGYQSIAEFTFKENKSKICATSSYYAGCMPEIFICTPIEKEDEPINLLENFHEFLDDL